MNDLSPVGHAELTRLEAELPRLEAELAQTEARYAEDRPRYESMRREYPKVREEEILAIQGFGRIRERIERTRAEIAHLRGELPSPWTTARPGASSKPSGDFLGSSPLSWAGRIS